MEIKYSCPCARHKSVAESEGIAALNSNLGGQLHTPAAVPLGKGPSAPTEYEFK